MEKREIWLAVIVLAVIVAAYLLVGSAYGGTQGLTAIQLTDPPQVPPGTSALVIAYSNVQVHLSNAGSQSGWTSSNVSGSINLMSLLNLKQTIAALKVPANATVDMVRFTVSSAKITINGTTNNVTVPSGKITAHIRGRTTLGGSASVLLSLSPTIATVVKSNMTTYLLVPSIRAVVVRNGTNTNLGAKGGLTKDDNDELNRDGQNITITTASITSFGNTTHLSVTVKDNSNTPVSIGHLAVIGNENVILNNSGIQLRIMAFANNLTAKAQNSTFCRNAQSGNASVRAGAIFGDGNREISDDFHVQINSSICTAAGAAAFKARLLQSFTNFSVSEEAQEIRIRAVLFKVNQDGSLSFPSREDDLREDDDSGNAMFQIQPGQSATLKFDGVFERARARVVLRPIVGSSYRIVVGGEDAIASLNTTATASTS